MNLKLKSRKAVYYTVLFPIFASIMFISDLLLDFAINVHFIGMFICVFTVVYRAKALIPIYLYVFLYGLYYGFNGYFFAYMYAWAVLWGIVMLLPKRMNASVSAAVYASAAGAHGLMFGTLLAPISAAMAGFSLKQTLMWILTGLSADLIHCIGNTVITFWLAVPLITALKKAESRI